MTSNLMKLRMCTIIAIILVGLQVFASKAHSKNVMTKYTRQINSIDDVTDKAEYNRLERKYDSVVRFVVKLTDNLCDMLLDSSLLAGTDLYNNMTLGKPSLIPSMNRMNVRPFLLSRVHAPFSVASDQVGYQFRPCQEASLRHRLNLAAFVRSTNAWSELPDVKKNNVSARRIRARISYNGANFSGSQRRSEQRTIIGTLGTSLWPALGQRVEFQAAGRTDAGVSASGQVITFDVIPSTAPMTKELVTDEPEDLFDVDGQPTRVATLADKLNSYLPRDLQIHEAVIVPRDFDVGRDCLWKRYSYRLPSSKDARRTVQSHVMRGARNRGEWMERPSRKAAPPSLNKFEAMKRAAALLEGTHDFGAFKAKSGERKEITVRTIFRCAVERRVESDGGEGYDLVVEGDGFLYKQVRIMAGTLMMVGMGLVPPETVKDALETPMKAEAISRGLAGPALPAEGCQLDHIEYDAAHPSQV